MRHPLEVKLRRYRFWATVYSMLTAAGYLLSVMAVVLLLLGTIDWYTRPTDPVIRLILWILALAPLLYVPLWLCRTIRRRRSNVQLAGDLEESLPPLHNWLAGAIDFLQIEKENPTVGSKELRDAVIQHATELSERFDFSKTLNQRPVYRAIGTMLFVLGLMAGIIALDPQIAQTASRRLTQPLVPINWPRKTLLVVKKSPTRLARGSSFEAIIVDEQGRALPEEATIFYRFDKKTPEQEGTEGEQGPSATEIETIRTDGRQIVLYRDRVDRSFSYRVVTGDDDRMPWQKVDVVEPPIVDSLQMKVTFPSYMGDITPVTIPITDRTCIREGSSIQLIAGVSSPVRRATLLLGKTRHEGQVDEKGRRILFPVGHIDRSTMSEQACPIVLILEDRHGLEVTIDRLQQLELIENQPPSITVLQPVTDDRIVATAVVPIEASIEDDLGVRSVVMRWTIQGIGGTRTSFEPIYEGPETLSAKTGDKNADPTPAHTGACPVSKQKLTLRYRWDLRPLKLTTDDRVTFRLVATDYSGIEATSEPVELMVVDPASFVNQLASEQRAIIDELVQTLAINHRNLQRMVQARQNLDTDGKVRIATVDLLRAVMLDRRQVVRTLTDENDGLIVRAKSIQNRLDHSRLRVTAFRRRLVRLIADLEELRTDILPPIEQNATLATKNAEQAFDPQNGITIRLIEILTPLAAAIRGQEQLISRLEAILNRLDNLVDYQRFYDDLKRLIQSQRELTEKTKTLGRSLLGRVKADLKPTELTRLEQTARSQALLARESGQAVVRMVEAVKRAGEAEGSRLARTVASSRARSLGATLARASEAIAQNRLGHAVRLQMESLAELEAMLRQMTQVTDSTAASPDSQQITIEGSPSGNTPGEEGTSQQDTPPGPETSGHPGEQPVETTTFDRDGQKIQSTHLKSKAVEGLIERLWGELPARERQRLIQLPGERFLPGYERQIEDYYKQLLDQ